MIYLLSPHFDDVCFSLGIVAKTNPGSVLINIFTRTSHVAEQPVLLNRSSQALDEISSLRNKEDKIFADSCELTRVNFDLEDATARGIEPFNLDNIEHEASALDQKLMDFFKSKASDEGTIYCPLGVGNHRNHISTLLVVLNNYDDLSSRFKVLFYEDLPYASNEMMRGEAVKRLKTFFADKILKRHFNMLSKEDFQIKKMLIESYKSQLASEFSFKDFCPAVEGVDDFHEAYWEVVVTQ